MYTAVVLHEKSRNLLQKKFQHLTQDYQIYCDHMTINLGYACDGPAPDLLGSEAELKVIGFAKNEKVIVAKVETKVPSLNKNKHITVAVNTKNNAKPKHSNEIDLWTDLLDPFFVYGIVKEVK